MGRRMMCAVVCATVMLGHATGASASTGKAPRSWQGS
jgi:hypothetical protein